MLAEAKLSRLLRLFPLVGKAKMNWEWFHIYSQVWLCILLADFLSGLLHWLEDTYAVPGISNWFDDAVVLPNIAHHIYPGRITKGTYLEHTRVTGTISFVFMLLLALLQVHAWQPYCVVLLASQFNQTHAWAHTKDVPPAVALLQRAGIIQSMEHHAEHHKAPYTVRYCTGTNFLNPVLDRIGFWRKLERLLRVPVARCSWKRWGY